MEQSTKPTPAALVQAQRAFFRSGATRSLKFRRKQLRLLGELLESHADQLLEALRLDMGKPATEAHFSEIGNTLHEVEKALANLEDWAAPRKVSTPLIHAPSSAWIQPEPYGVTTVIAPWNYPVSLLLIPAIGAIAAGNTVILKPSTYVPHTIACLTDIINLNFPPEYLHLSVGGRAHTTALLQEKLDYIFFTGSPMVGRIVMRAAAEHLTPLTLELGGKSPAILHQDASMQGSIRRLVWGKFFNAGQTCVAPDYLLVHRRKYKRALEMIQAQLEAFFGTDPRNSPDFARIVNDRHFSRLEALIPEEVVCGGISDASSRYIAPTVVDLGDDPKSTLMEDEIFGPILPIIPYDTLDEALNFINARPKPLALYLFSQSQKVQERVMRETSSGGMVMNDVVVHLSLTELPFGGVGESGMGQYHGQHSFDTFSHLKSVLKKNFLLDPAIRYAPYKRDINVVRSLYDWFG